MSRIALALLLVLAGCGSDDQIANRGNETRHWTDALPRQAWSEFERMDDGSGWFEVYRIRDHILAIYEPGQFEEVISFLVIGREKALLFDTGLGIGNMQALVTELTNKPVMVLNSHSHYDHIGSNYQFDNILGQNHPYTASRSQGLLHEDVGEWVSDAWVQKDWPAGFDPGSYRIRPYQFSQLVGNTQFIDLGGVSMEIIRSPGHAPDGISLLDHQNRLLFTGDTFYLAPLYAHLEGSDFSAYRATAASLAQLEPLVDYLLTSHNVPVAPARYLTALNQALTAIAEGHAPYQPTDGGREYTFEGFSVLTGDPP